jgi:hypothetical protein
MRRTKNVPSGELCVPHGFELSFGDSESFRFQSTWSAGDWWTWCSPDVVDGFVMHLVLDSDWANEVRKLGEEAVD